MPSFTQHPEAEPSVGEKVPLPVPTVPTFSPISRRIEQLTETTADRSLELTDLVLSDPAATLAVLDASNRIVCGLGVSITTVESALSVLGRDRTRSVLRAVSEGPQMAHSVGAMAALRHCVVTGMVATSLSKILEQANAAEARVAGLLHDCALLTSSGDAKYAEAEGARILKAHKLPHRLVAAVAGHLAAKGSRSRRVDDTLGSLLAHAERLARELVGMPHDDRDSGASAYDDRARALSELVYERVSKDVGDGLLVLGVLLGSPRLTLENFSAEMLRVAQRGGRKAVSFSGLGGPMQRTMAELRSAETEASALERLVHGVRSFAGVGAGLLLLSEPGEAMIGGDSEELPFYLRARDLSHRARGLLEEVGAAQEEGRSRIAIAVRGSHLLPSEEALIAPLVVGGKRIGAVLVPLLKQVERPILEILDVLVATTGEVLERIQLSRRSFLIEERMTKDPLTGVLQRSHILDLLDAEVKVANRHRKPLTLVMVDVDHFKSWNDTHGHQEGDALLRDLAGVLRDCARDDDLVGRYGGDEFVVILPGQRADGGVAYAERARLGVQRLGLRRNDPERPLKLGISAGVSAIRRHPMEAGALLFRADQALYQAKVRGKNRVHID